VAAVYRYKLIRFNVKIMLAGDGDSQVSARLIFLFYTDQFRTAAAALLVLLR
jgi:hypothetical protein